MARGQIYEYALKVIHLSRIGLISESSGAREGRLLAFRRAMRSEVDNVNPWGE